MDEGAVDAEGGLGGVDEGVGGGLVGGSLFRGGE